MEKNRAPKRRSRISLVLALIMVAELAVAGFKYPGFLIPPQPDYSKYMIKPPKEKATEQVTKAPTEEPVPVQTEEPTEAPTGEPVEETPVTAEKTSVTAEETDAPEEEYAVSALDSEIRLRYTEEQIAAAPERRAPVTRYEPRAELGEVTVEITAWNLDNEEDQVIVKDLPVLSEGEEGWSVKAYDFALASGQREFSTGATITLPRDAGAGLSGCVRFNEEEGVWEDEYFEVSEDGKNYIIYTDHFSGHGVKTYRFDIGKYELADADGETVSLGDGIFVELYEKGVNRMNRKVEIDQERMWNMYKKKTEKDISTLGSTLEAMAAKSAADGSRFYDFLDMEQNLFGYLSAASTAAGMPGEAAEWILLRSELPGRDLLGESFMALDVMLTTLKIGEEAKQGSRTVEDVIRALPGAAMNHLQEITGIGLTVVSATYLTPWIASVVGLLWWAGTTIYNSVPAGPTPVDPKVEDFYRYCYLRSNTRVYFGEPLSRSEFESGPKNPITMRPLNTMEDEDFRILEKVVNKYNLYRFPEVKKQEAAWYDFTGLLTEKETVSASYTRGWPEAFKAILTLCAGKEPEYLEAVLNEFYWNYAHAFWQQEEETMDTWLSEAYSSERKGSFASYEQMNGGKELTMAEKIRYTERFVATLKEETRPVLQDVMKRMQWDSCREMVKTMKTKVVPLLNCQLTFRVKDGNLAEGAPFQSSAYCVNWKELEANKKYVKGGKKVRYDDEALMTPMRFAGVSGALFLPMEARKSGDEPEPTRKENYYPYTADFLPRAGKKDNAVYRCTYYHYLMMGAPKQMIFRRVDSKEAWEADAGAPGIIRLPELTKTTMTDGRDPLTGEVTKVPYTYVKAEADVEIVIPREGTAMYRFDDVNDHNGSSVAYMAAGELLGKALKGQTIVPGKDGSFSLSGSAARVSPASRSSFSFIPDGDSNDPELWTETESYAYLDFEITGTYDPETEKGTCTLTGNVHGDEKGRTGLKSGKVLTSGTNWSGSFSGSTDRVYIVHYNAGDALEIDFLSPKGNEQKDPLMQQATVHDSFDETYEVNEQWWLTLSFMKR